MAATVSVNATTEFTIPVPPPAGPRLDAGGAITIGDYHWKLISEAERPGVGLMPYPPASKLSISLDARDYDGGLEELYFMKFHNGDDEAEVGGVCVCVCVCVYVCVCVCV